MKATWRWLRGDHAKVTIGQIWLPTYVVAGEALAADSPRRRRLLKVPVVIKPTEKLETAFCRLKLKFIFMDKELAILDLVPKTAWAPENYAAAGRLYIEGGRFASSGAQLVVTYQPFGAAIVSGAMGPEGFLNLNEVGGKAVVGQFDLLLIIDFPATTKGLKLHVKGALDVTDPNIPLTERADVLILDHSIEVRL